MPRTFVTIQIAIAVIALPAALILWFAFVRQVPEQTATGAIRAKTFLDAHTITRYPSNVYRQSWTPNVIRVNEAFIFSIDLDGVGEALFALDTTSSKDYQVGQKVAVRYEARGIPPFWKQVRVKGITPG